MADFSIGQRFTQLIQQLGLSKNAFAMSLDKTATVIQHLVDERNKPGYDLICKVFEVYPNVSKDWLLLGQGPMLVNGPTPPALLKAEAEDASPAPTPVAKAAAAVSAAPLPPATPPAPAPIVVVGEAVIAPVAAAAPVAVPSPPAPAATLPPPAPAAPVVLPAPDATYLTAALQTQYLQHQLALVEQRNQHLLAQHQLMQQMLDLLQRTS
ncbi:MAG: hypothetical protein ACRYG7_01470 [Janthinobacterium lividum]